MTTVSLNRQQDLNTLIEHLQPAGIPLRMAPGTMLSCSEQGEPVCYGLLAGSAVVYRKEDNLALATVSAPFIFGLSGYLCQKSTDSIYVKAETPLDVFSLPAARAKEIINKEGLWEKAYGITALYLTAFYHRINDITQHSSCQIVHALLLRLEKEPAVIRRHTTACHYILERSSLSRSGIMLALKNLKKKGLIHTYQGKLLSVSPLPNRPSRLS